MELPTQLSYFLVLYDIKNISKAAEEMFISRQALSSKLKDLERIVGSKLFLRCKNGIRPTEAAHILYEYVLRDSLLWETTLQRIRVHSNKVIIKIGIDLLHHPLPMIRSILAYQDINPKTKIELINESDHTRFWRNLQNEKLDIAVTIEAPIGDGLEQIKVLESKMFLLMHKKNELAKKEKLSFFRDLKGKKVLCSSNYLMAELSPFLYEAGIETDLITNHISVLIEALESDRGLYPVPEQLASYLCSDQITARECMLFPIGATAYLLFRPECSHEIKHFIEYLVNTVYPIYQSAYFHNQETDALNDTNK